MSAFVQLPACKTLTFCPVPFCKTLPANASLQGPLFAPKQCFQRFSVQKFKNPPNSKINSKHNYFWQKNPQNHCSQPSLNLLTVVSSASLIRSHSVFLSGVSFLYSSQSSARFNTEVRQSCSLWRRVVPQFDISCFRIFAGLFWMVFPHFGHVYRFVWCLLMCVCSRDFLLNTQTWNCAGIR